MLPRLLVGGIIWVAFSVAFFLGVQHASRDKYEDLKAAYLRGYNNGYEARSIDGGKTFAGNVDSAVIARLSDIERAGWDVAERVTEEYTLNEKEKEAARLFVNQEHCTTLQRETIRSILRRLL